MSGHPNFPTISENQSTIEVGGSKFTVIVSTHRVLGVDGDVLGIKFRNETGSMDSSIRVKGVDSFSVINALSSRAQQIILPLLNKVSMVGFYLLTDGLEERGKDAILAKSRLYDMGARKMHKSFKHELPLITKLQLEGAFAWVMSKAEITSTSLFFELQREFTRQIEVC